jgi:hypothetical protein
VSILGFSHLVSEVSSTDLAVDHYGLLGYTPEFTTTYKVEARKHFILDSTQKTVQLTYLRHSSMRRIGIEVITHDRKSQEKAKRVLSYGVTAPTLDTRVIQDPDGNATIVIPQDDHKFYQHIFLPTSSFDETVHFYKTLFSFVGRDGKQFAKTPYDALGIDYNRTMSLGLSKCMFPSWDVTLHLVEINGALNDIYLNQVGFLCFCLIVDETELIRLQKSGVELFGPFFGEKLVKERNVVFTYSFVRDPNNFIVELYVQK